MSIIKAFTAKTTDQCCKCGATIEVGQQISWLRNAERKGNFHVSCSEKPTIPALTLVKVKDVGSPLGWVWMRVNAIPSIKERLNLKPFKTGLDYKALAEPLPGPWEVKPAAAALPDLNPSTTVPEMSTDGILLNAIAKALLPALGKMIAEQKGPRIVVHVHVEKPGDEVGVLNTLRNELATLQGVKGL